MRIKGYAYHNGPIKNEISECKHFAKNVQHVLLNNEVNIPCMLVQLLRSER